MEVASVFRRNPSHPSALALKAWFGPSFRDLQEGKLPEQEALLNDLINRLPAYSSNKPLYRGILFYNETERNAFIGKFKVDVWENNRPFMSSSKDGSASIGFAGKASYPVYLKILNNKTGRDVEPFAFMHPKFSWQKEVLFIKGSKFKVRNTQAVDLIGKSVYTITLEEVK